MSLVEEEKQLAREKAKQKRMAFVMLGIAIVAEVTGAICLKASEGLTVPLPSVVTVVGYVVSFTLLVLTKAERREASVKRRPKSLPV